MLDKLKGNLCKTCKYNNNCKPCIYDIVVGYSEGGIGTIVSCIMYMRINKDKMSIKKINEIILDNKRWL